jgi:type II secretory pathway component PulK
MSQALHVNFALAIHRRRSQRRGVIFIAALGIIAILSGLLLAFAIDMRTEAIAAANRQSEIQAEEAEQAGEEFVCANVDFESTAGTNSTSGASQPDSWTLCYNTPTEAVQVGNGYFWIIRPSEVDDTDYEYGITDECSKLNINATSFTAALLTALPTDMTSDVADAVMDWKSSAGKATSDGAETDYYNGLTEPYDAKNQPYESVEEMLLVRGITPQTLFGYDLNRNGTIEDSERTESNNASLGFDTTGNDSRGIFRYLTVYTTGEPALMTANTGGGGGGGGGTSTKAALGLLNVNTVSENVLMAEGLTQSQADTLIQAAQSTTGGLTSLSDVQTAIAGAQVPNSLLQAMTATSYQYSADIVGVSGDGRSFKRVRIVVDCSPSSTTASTTGTTGGGGGGAAASGATVPSRIVYRRDLTGYGWPLSPDIRTALRSGTNFQPGTPGSNLGNNH